MHNTKGVACNINNLKSEEREKYKFLYAINVRFLST